MNKSLYIPITAMLAVTLSLTACHDSDPKAKYEDIYGTWEQVGYGDVLVINKDGADYYQHTRQTCIKDSSLDNTELGEFINDLDVPTDQQSFSVRLQASNLFKAQLTRLDQLPVSCQADRLITTATPTRQFEHLWHTFNDYYAFFDQRGVDWQQQYTTYRPMIDDAMDQKALFSVLADMLAPLDDDHVSLSTGDDGFSPAQPPNFVIALYQAFQQQSEISDFNEFEEAQLDNMQQVQGTYLSQVKQAGGPDDEVALWGRIKGDKGDIGYLQLSRMAGIDSQVDLSDIDTIDPEKDLIAIENIMQQVTSDLQDVSALVIDIRFNGGGLDSVGMAIANYFTRQHQLALSKYTENWQGRSQHVKAYLNPAKQHLLVPIALLSSDMTVSAAETFLMTMRSIPQVSVVGEPSSGALSDVLTKNMLKGLEADLSNEVYLDHAGRNYEVSGVPVDVATTAFDLDGFAKGKDTALDAALDHLSAQIQ